MPRTARTTLIALAALLLPAAAGPVSALPPVEPPCVACFPDPTDPWMDLLGSAVDSIAGGAVPDSSADILMVGEGVATVQRGSISFTCQGPSTMTVEASRKSFGVEPTATISYGGAQGGGSWIAACAMGQRTQPIKGDITGEFDGAWGASESHATFSYVFSSTAPKPDGTRDVSFVLTWSNGDLDTFTGTLTEYR